MFIGSYALIFSYFISFLVISSVSLAFYWSELHGIDRTVLMRALKLLEHKGKLAIFKGTSADDEGVKFSL